MMEGSVSLHSLIHVILKALRELCRLWRKLRHVALNQAGLYPATDDAPTTPILADDATKRSSQEASLDDQAITCVYRGTQS